MKYMNTDQTSNKFEALLLAVASGVVVYVYLRNSTGRRWISAFVRRYGMGLLPMIGGLFSLRENVGPVRD